jgi:two-component system chemotaxis response regulator CheB
VSDVRTVGKPVAIFVGASAGGVTTLQTLIHALDSNFRIPMVVVLHLPAHSTFIPSLVFRDSFDRQLVEVVDKIPLKPNHIYFAPPDYHVLAERDGSLSLSQDEPVQFSRPSIDVLFDSAAKAFGASACGLLLTGANSDGAQGMLSINRAFGYTMVQDPQSAECAVMPNSALALIKPDFIGDIAAIARHLIKVQGAVG